MEPSELEEIKLQQKNGKNLGWSRIYLQKLRNYFREYCEVSSIQGLSYIGKKSSIIERIWWITIFTICVSGSSLMVYKIFDKWSKTPVLVSLATKEEPIYDIPFPAVTICPESKISTQCSNYTKILMARIRKNMKNTTYTENKYFDYMGLLCSSKNHDPSMQLGNRSLLELFNESIPELNDRYPTDFHVPDYGDFLYDCAAVKLKEAYCQWMGVTRSCVDLMTPIITDEGLCYTFNMFNQKELYSEINQAKMYDWEKKSNWNPDFGYPQHRVEEVYPRRIFLNGAKNSFTAVFFTRKDQLDHGCRDFSLQGIRVSLNIPTRIPRPSQVFFSVGLNRFTSAAVTPSTTSVAKSIQVYDPLKRNCYFSNERKLKYFQIYSQGNCNIECWTNFTLSKCNCVNFHMPRDNQTKVCSLQERFCLEQARVEYPQAVLSERLWAQSTNISKREGMVFDCKCLPFCSDLIYNAEITSGKWDFDNLDEALFDDMRDFTDEHYASAVRVYFKNSFFLPMKKDELYGTTDAISDIGGVLGLFIGFSLFSVAEIVYFLSIRLIESYRLRHFNSNKITPTERY
ncbi:hypothetical protein WA026_001532 [Henosepilachna vigintioctopunctata]|uniref:Uncharacterized protein n=1 Tax=Henosepilachna vigintioctopunctata TaxID=420089 RepID=A0AAW1US91_9CUCU